MRRFAAFSLSRIAAIMSCGLPNYAITPFSQPPGKFPGRPARLNLLIAARGYDKVHTRISDDAISREASLRDMRADNFPMIDSFAGKEI
jgi:hypothetical protein